MRATKRRVGIVAGLCAAVIGLAAAAQYVRHGYGAGPDPGTAVPVAAVRTGTVPTPGNDVRGPGIPPAPGSSENAPPDPNNGAPTANLKRIANNLHLTYKSVTAVVTLPAGLGVTNRVDVSVLFGTGAQAKRITQSYNNSNGNRIVYDFPANDGQRRREEVTTSLAEASSEANLTYAVRSTVDLEPLFDIALSPITFTLINDCDRYGDSEPDIAWRHPDGKVDHYLMSMRSGDTRTIGRFERTFSEVGQSATLGIPIFLLFEDDLGNFYNWRFVPELVTPALPGRTHTASFKLSEAGDSNCAGEVRYRITYTVRHYTSL
jgi:hypothetical protein